MPESIQLNSASLWTRILLGAAGLTLLSLGLSTFLAALLGAAGDQVGQRVFSAFNLGLAMFVAAECVALIAVLAMRMEFPPSK